MNTSFEIEPNQEIRNTVCLFTSTSGNLSVDCNERFLFAVTIFLIVWEYVQRTHTVWWDEQLPFRQWVERYISADALFS